MTRLIDADELIKSYLDHNRAEFEIKNCCMANENVISIINNAPTVNTKELKPLVDKVVEILPELTDAVIKELPKLVSGSIKCSECSYYTNTFNDEWVRKVDIVHYIATQYSEHNELVPTWLSIGEMKGGAE